jgi:hypothetical protein
LTAIIEPENNINNRIDLNFTGNDRRAAPSDRMYPKTPSTFPQLVSPQIGLKLAADSYSSNNHCNTKASILDILPRDTSPKASSNHNTLASS